MPARTSRHARVFIPVLAALVALAWAALWAWTRSPYGRYMEHGDWTASGPAAFLCQAVPAGGILVPAALYAAAWILMTAAMMLPTTLPLFNAFDRVTAGRADHGGLLVRLALGYMAVWGAFGLAAHALHAALLALLARIPELAWHGWVIGAATIALAGAFQFSRLKYRCLDKCRTPLSFVMQHWRGTAPERDAFALGAHHGLYCVGCCWALMMLMFALGAGSLGWMLLLAAVMAVEKNVAWGRRLSAPLGLALLAWSAVVVATHA
ncbi:membrane protein [Ramlibacter tataouinensis]|uniref:Membrane protein n=1 Tax=Ramlibacter tataouinensis TaxID=94132 RepID=A0A127K055_9BURK|nr:membrane protein [Ramlibacter tataouinensis]